MSSAWAWLRPVGSPPIPVPNLQEHTHSLLVVESPRARRQTGARSLTSP